MPLRWLRPYARREVGLTHRSSTPLLCAVAAAIALAASLPATATAHPSPASTVAGHAAEDSVVPLDPATERRFERLTAEATAADAASASRAAPGDDPSQVGEWGPVMPWPVVGIHVALLENGKVLAYDSVGDLLSSPVHNSTRATVWDPVTGSHTAANVAGFNIFCSGLAHLADGSLFLPGGNKNAELDGIVQTHYFEASTNAWSRGPDMAEERWYPSVTPLSNGESLITSGGPDVPEVLRTTGGLRTLNTAALELPEYPWIDVAPDGRAFYSGPEVTMKTLDTSGGGSWQFFGNRDSLHRDYGSRALYDIGKILVAGGGASSRDARVINMNGTTPQVSATAQMSDGRRQHNLTVLADGTVLATGGNSSGADLVDLNNGVYRAELWDPATGQWQNQASMQVTRQYHSTALLLPDGRVLSSGGGVCGRCQEVGYLAKNAEVFSPAYLFDDSGQPAARPVISSAPGDVGYNTPFAVSTPNAASISKVALVRLGAVTHSVNMEQRYVPLSFTTGGGTVTATSPVSANIAPPGPYMLFVINGDGVPSVAKIVNVGAAPPPPVVSSVSPAGGATGVARTTTVSATFDRAMNRASVESAFSLTRTSGGASVSGRFSWSGNTVTFTPSAPLSGATGHTATVGTGARDSGGVALASPRTWQFKTANQPPPQGDCGAIIRGSAGDDELRGGPGAQELIGLAGRDTLRGEGGSDCIRGGAGRDRIHGGGGRDEIDGGPGKDVINAKDGERDDVDCGPGRDRAKVDGKDRVRGCKRR